MIRTVDYLLHYMVLISKQIAYFSHVIGMLPANFIKFVEVSQRIKIMYK